MTTKRFRHQQGEYDRHRFAVARAYLWSMRTGKTRMAVESARALHDAMEINGVLVVAPNGVHRQWAEEQVHKWGGKFNNAFAWSFSNPRNPHDFELFMASCRHGSLSLHWLCVNMEVILRKDVRRAVALFKKAVGRAMLIVDESHHMARPGSKRTAVARGLGRQFEYRRILTGTVAEEAPEQTFSQFEILERGALGHTTYGGSKEASRHPCPTCGPRCRGFKHEFVEFEDGYARGHSFKVVVGHKNLDVLKERMATYSSVVLRSDCEDLPDLMEQDRIAEMTPAQLKLWNEVADQALEALEARGIDQVWDGGSALVKLQQVEGGFFRMPGKVERLLDLCGRDNPKMLILNDEIMQYDGQVVCWFAYTHELEAAMKALTGAKVTCGRFHGKVGQAEREENLRLFKKKRIKVLLAQPAAGGEGREMPAGLMLWYSQAMSARVRAQASERATRMGGSSVQLVDVMTPTSRYLRDMCRRKSSVAEDVGRSGLRAVIDKIKRGA